MQAEAFQRTLHHKPLITIILMIQIRRNGLLTVIKVDVITRDVKAVTELRETDTSSVSLQPSKTREIFKQHRTKTQCAAIAREN